MSAEINNNQTPKNLINIITFNVRATKTIGDDGIIPWINIGTANEEILNLVDADETVIAEHKVTVSIDYPLSNPTTFQLISSIGFSRTLLLIEIRTQLLKYAALENESFEISNLDLVALDVYKTDAGKIEITLDIDA